MKDRHIWEGWTVKSFIDELEPQFQMIQNGLSWMKKFKNDETGHTRLKEWCKNNQPYYKRHIPEVYNYFKSKLV